MFKGRQIALIAALTLAACQGRRSNSPIAEPAPPTATEARATQLDGAVVFIGDSRIDLLATSNVTDRSENLGVSGEDLAGLAARLHGVNLSGARAIVLETGANDWLTVHGHDFSTRYSGVLAELPDRPLLMAAVLPVNEAQVMQFYAGRFDWRGANAAMVGWNDSISALCASRPQCRYVGVPAELRDGDQLKATLSTDGVHLNAAGAAIWSGALRQALTAPS